MRHDDRGEKWISIKSMKKSKKKNILQDKHRSD